MPQRVGSVVDAASLLPVPATRRHWRLGVGVSNHDADFERFFLANYEAVLYILTLITGDREQATDATQEAFIRAYSRWSKIRTYDSPSAWVRRVAINASHDSMRSDRRRRRREESQRVDHEPSPADRSTSDAVTLALLAALPHRQREVATLFYVDDRSVAETAAILGLSEGTVKSYLAAARDRLRQLLDQNGDLT